jgi:hypothetical protein
MYTKKYGASLLLTIFKKSCFVQGGTAYQFYTKEEKQLLYESLSHCKWDYKYHIVFTPKGYKKVF